MGELEEGTGAGVRDGKGGEVSVGDSGEELPGGFRQKWEELAKVEPRKLDN